VDSLEEHQKMKGKPLLFRLYKYDLFSQEYCPPKLLIKRLLTNIRRDEDTQAHLSYQVQILFAKGWPTLQIVVVLRQIQFCKSGVLARCTAED